MRPEIIYTTPKAMVNYPHLGKLPKMGKTGRKNVRQAPEQDEYPDLPWIIMKNWRV